MSRTLHLPGAGGRVRRAASAWLTKSFNFAGVAEMTSMADLPSRNFAYGFRVADMVDLSWQLSVASCQLMLNQKQGLRVSAVIFSVSKERLHESCGDHRASVAGRLVCILWA